MAMLLSTEASPHSGQQPENVTVQSDGSLHVSHAGATPGRPPDPPVPPELLVLVSLSSVLERVVAPHPIRSVNPTIPQMSPSADKKMTVAVGASRR